MEKKFVKKPFNTIIEHICESRTCYLRRGPYCIASLTEVRNDADEFSWIIKPNYEQLEACGFYFIPGIDLDIHLEEYVRTNVIPSVVSRRTYPDNRDMLIPVLKYMGLRWNDRFEFMCLSMGWCGNDNDYITRTPNEVVDYKAIIEGRTEDVPHGKPLEHCNSYIKGATIHCVPTRFFTDGYYKKELIKQGRIKEDEE